MLREDFERILKEHGLKKTKQRVLVLEALASCGDEHLTAEEIYEIVKAEFPEIGLATVYRTIQLLSGLGLVESIQLGDGYVRYEIGKIGGTEAHHHHHLILLPLNMKTVLLWWTAGCHSQKMTCWALTW